MNKVEMIYDKDSGKQNVNAPKPGPIFGLLILWRTRWFPQSYQSLQFQKQAQLPNQNLFENRNHLHLSQNQGRLQNQIKVEISFGKLDTAFTFKSFLVT